MKCADVTPSSLAGSGSRWCYAIDMLLGPTRPLLLPLRAAGGFVRGRQTFPNGERFLGNRRQRIGQATAIHGFIVRCPAAKEFHPVRVSTIQRISCNGNNNETKAYRILRFWMKPLSDPLHDPFSCPFSYTRKSDVQILASLCRSPGQCRRMPCFTCVASACQRPA